LVDPAVNGIADKADDAAPVAVDFGDEGVVNQI
jgi:hypothetical protein